MRLNSKLTWGLAWAGLALVIAVPGLDAFSSNTAAPALITSDTDQVKDVATTSSEPPKTEAATSTTPPKPGSITINPDGTVVRSTGPVTAPISTGTASTPAATETKVATAEEPKAPLVAPTPAPASARPKSQPAATATVTPPAATGLPPAATAKPPTATITTPPATPLILDETETAAIEDDPDDLIPPAGIDDDPAALREYLESRGLLEPYDSRSSASVQYIDPPVQQEASEDYDPDGFFLSDGPNNSERRTTRRSARSGWWYDEYGNLIFF